MKKSLIILLFMFFYNSLIANSFSIIVSPQIGLEKNNILFNESIENINLNSQIDFVFIIGNLTFDGKESSFNLLFSYLDLLKKPFFIVPGNNDNRWSQSGGLNLIKHSKFSKKMGNSLFVGLNTGIVWKEANGHFKPEDLTWFKKEVEIQNSQNIFLFIGNDFNLIDNKDILDILVDNSTIKTTFSPSIDNKSSNLKLPNLVLNEQFIVNNWNYYLFNSDSLSLSLISEKGTQKIKLDNKMSNVKPIEKSKSVYNEIESVFSMNLKSTLYAEPTIWQNKIYVVDYFGKVTCLDSLGNKIWDYDLFGNVVSKPYVFDGYLAIGTLQGELVTLNAYTGKQIQSIGFDEPITSGIIGFEYTGRKELLIADPEGSKHAISFGTKSGKLFCYNLEYMEELWVNNSAKNFISTTPLLVDTRIIYGAWDGTIYTIDNRNGNMIWRWIIDRNFKNSNAGCKPVHDGNRVFFASSDGFVTALDLRLGGSIWRKNNFRVWESIGISQDKSKLYAIGVNNRFHIIHPKEGHWLKEIVTKQGIDKSNNSIYDYNGLVVYSTQDGKIYSVDSRARHKEIYQMGNTHLHSIIPLSENKFLLSNIDGDLSIIKIKAIN